MKQINFASADDESKNNLKLVVTSLLEVLSNVSLTQDVPGMKEVVDAAQWALLESMSIISVAYFVDTSLTILNSDNVPVCYPNKRFNSLDLLSWLNFFRL